MTRLPIVSPLVRALVSPIRKSGNLLISVPTPRTTIVENVTDFDTGWSLSGIGVHDSVAADYVGSSFADQTSEDSSTGLHGEQRAGSALVSGLQYAADFVLKPAGRTFLLIQIAGAGTNSYGIFDLDTNTIGDSSGVDSNVIMDLSNGWKFVRMVFTPTASVAHSCNLFHATSSSNFTMAGTPNAGFLMDRYVLSHN